MGLVYEHWRPDINECFYVGASRDAEDSRPYDYGSHNEDYDAVVEHLTEIGMQPFTEIIWEGLAYECTGTYEKLRIAYQRSLLGDKLTNKALGGFGFGIEWTDEQRAKHSEILTKTRNKPEFIELQSDISTALWQDDEFREKTISAQNAGKALFRESPKFAEYVEKQREISAIIWSDAARCAEQSLRATESWSNPVLIEEQSIRTTESWKDPEIRKNRISGLNRPEVIAHNSEVVTALWQTQSYRDKMMLHAWWLSNVRDRKYWGA
jgi:hypothetical protein